MKKETWRIILSVLCGLQPPFIMWLGGYEFGERGFPLVCSYVFSVFMSVWAYQYPGWERE
jgi:hypothetical protein